VIEAAYPREVETERLLLRQFRQADFEAYLRIASNPEIRRFYGNEDPPTRVDAWRHMAMIAGVWTLRGYGHWAVEVKASGELIGRVGLWFPDWYPEVEAAWTIARDHWGSGYATEAGKEALRQGFTTLKLAHVISLIRPDNIGSRRVAEKLGGVVEQTELIDGHETVVYGYTAAPQ
jgi:RimJ/RimL family protein N-acetyltransferase